MSETYPRRPYAIERSSNSPSWHDYTIALVDKCSRVATCGYSIVHISCTPTFMYTTVFIQGTKQALRHSTINRTYLGTLFLSARDATSLCNRLPTSQRHKSPLPSQVSGPVKMPSCLLDGNAAHNFSVTVRPSAKVQHRDIIPTPSTLTD